MYDYVIIFSMERGAGKVVVPSLCRVVHGRLSWLLLSSVFPMLFFCSVCCSGAGVSPGLLLACVKSPVLIAIVYVTTLNC